MEIFIFGSFRTLQVISLRQLTAGGGKYVAPKVGERLDRLTQWTLFCMIRLCMTRGAPIIEWTWLFNTN